MRRKASRADERATAAQEDAVVARAEAAMKAQEVADMEAKLKRAEASEAKARETAFDEATAVFRRHFTDAWNPSGTLLPFLGIWFFTYLEYTNRKKGTLIVSGLLGYQGVVNEGRQGVNVKGGRVHGFSVGRGGGAAPEGKKAWV